MCALCAENPQVRQTPPKLSFADPARLAQIGAAGRAWYDQQRILEFEALQQTYTRLAAKGNDRITP